MNKLIVVLAATLCLLTACDSIDNKALPSYTVRLVARGVAAATAAYAPWAFDAACPVERRADITLTIDPSTLDAVCPSCGSHYNVLNGAGGPLSGEALSQKLGLTTYKCRQNANGGYTIASY